MRRGPAVCCTQSFSPNLVRDHGQSAHEHGEQDAERRERLIGKTRHRDCDAWMTRDRRKREHGAIVFVRAAKKMADGEPQQRDQYDGSERSFAHERCHQRPRADEDRYDADEQHEATRPLHRRHPGSRRGPPMTDRKPDPERQQH